MHNVHVYVRACVIWYAPHIRHTMEKMDGALTRNVCAMRSGYSTLSFDDSARTNSY